MNRRQVERITSPGLALAAVVSAVLVAVDSGRAELWIVPAPAVAAIGCLLGMRLSLKMRAPGAASVFMAESLFWLGTAGYLIWLYLTSP